MIDQFIAAGESKWLRQSGLVMLLPHGFDGQVRSHEARLRHNLIIIYLVLHLSAADGCMLS